MRCTSSSWSAAGTPCSRSPENVVLVRAATSRAALVAALRLARRDVVPDPTLAVDGKPARQRFLGIRTVIECGASAWSGSRDGRVERIGPGVEATYLSYRVTGRRALKKLLRGADVEVTLEA
jgi:hypothetical protein